MIKITDILITFSSATTATRIKKDLTSKGISAQVIQTPKALSKNGCSYSVKTVISALPTAEACAEKLSVKIKNIYRFDGTDYVELR